MSARLIVIGAVAALAVGCGARPTKTLDEAEAALNGAILAKKCAPEEYAAAERMNAKAKQLADEGKNDEAAAAARAAKKLAVKAQQKAALLKEECFRPKNEGVDVSEYIDESGSGLDNPDLKDEGGMKTVYFDYNAAELTPEARETVAKNAAWIRANPDKPIIIEGHCDSRGSTEYNLALGEKRAMVVRKYMGQLGIPPERLSVVSYGEEQPLDYSESESGHARNRRAEFNTR